jgi:hypothetical protein
MIQNRREVEFFNIFRYDDEQVIKVADFTNDDFDLPPDSGKPPEIDLDSPGAYADVLNCEMGMDPMFVSHRVVDAIKSAGFSGAEFRKLKIVRRKSVPPPPCDYYMLDIKGKPLDFCRQYFRYSPASPDSGRTIELIKEIFDSGLKADGSKLEIPDYTRRIPVLRTWGHSDMMQWSIVTEIGTSGNFVCTRRFLKLAWEQKWTNFAALPIDSFEIIAWKPLSECSWPPENWYPDFQAPQWRMSLSEDGLPRPNAGT